MAKNGKHADSVDKFESLRQADEVLQFTKFAMDNASVEIYWLGSDARIHYVNNQACKSLGYTKEEFLNLYIPDIDPLLPIDLWSDHWESLKRDKTQIFETQHKKKSGELFDVEIIANYVKFGRLEYNVAYSRDITERKKIAADLKLAHTLEVIKSEQLRKSEKILRESEKHIRVLFNSGNDPILVYEIDSISGAPFKHFVEVNDVACSRLGYSREELLLMRPEDIVAPEASAHPAPNFKIAYNRKGVYESTYLTRDGQPFPVEINAHVFDLYDKTLVFAMARDITERKKAEADLKLAHAEIALRNAELEQISITDRLTGLFNRRKLDDVLIQELERVMRYGQDLSVILVDIDKFKSVNDQYGHLTGDIVLTSIAGLLQQGVRKTDISGRWGGEEFLVICPSSNLEGAIALAEHLRQMVEANEYDIVGRKTCSFGVAQMAKNEPINAMIARADSALYRAKERGRNCVEADDKSS